MVARLPCDRAGLSGADNCFSSETDIGGSSLQGTLYQLYLRDRAIHYQVLLQEQ